MDNFHLDITTDKEDELKKALEIAFNHAPGNKATGYSIVNDNVFVLFWHADENVLKVDKRVWDKKDEYWRTELVESTGGTYTAFPAPITIESAFVMVKEWLKTAKRVGWIDMDGSCKPKAVRVFNEDWGHVYRSHYAFVGVQACHAWYGK